LQQGNVNKIRTLWQSPLAGTSSVVASAALDELQLATGGPYNPSNPVTRVALYYYSLYAKTGAQATTNVANPFSSGI